MLDNGAILHPGREIKWAAVNGHLDVVNCLLANGATPSYISLEWAAKQGHLEVVNSLLANGANIDERTFALQLAAENGHLDVVKTLLANGATLHQSRAALRWGHLERHPEVAETIEKHIPSAQQPCSLMHGCRATIRDRLIKHLVDGKPLKPAIDSLPLPPGMREYLYNPLQW